MNEFESNGDDDNDGDLAPCCHILLQRNGEHGSRVTPLRHTVRILGTTENDSTFTIVHYPVLIFKNTSSNQPPLSKHPLVRKLTKCYNYDSCISYNDAVLLQCEKDILILMNELIAVTNWRTLGSNLNIVESTLDVVEQENSKTELRKRDVLKRWLKLKPKAAWKDVVSALRHMEENRVANSIEKKYCGGGTDVHTSARSNNKIHYCIMKFTVNLHS